MFRAQSLLSPSITVALLATGAASVAAQPESTPVHVATIRGQASGVAVLRRALDRGIEEELTLREADRRRARYVVRGAIVDCDRRRAGRQNEVRCEVAWVVTEGSSENVRAVMKSSGTARGRDVRHLREAALEASTRSVIRTLASPAQLARHQPS